MTCVPRSIALAIDDRSSVFWLFSSTVTLVSPGFKKRIPPLSAVNSIEDHSLILNGRICMWVPKSKGTPHMADHGNRRVFSDSIEE